MNKFILYLEDDASMKKHTVEMLKEENFNVKGFNRIDQAKNCFAKYTDEILCIITDLNLNDEWLQEHQTESNGGIISGWIWLQKFVYNQKPDIPTVIYSGYIGYLKEILSEQGKLSELLRNNIKCVEKGVNDEDGFTGLLRALESLL